VIVLEANRTNSAPYNPGIYDINSTNQTHFPLMRTKQSSAMTILLLKANGHFPFGRGRLTWSFLFGRLHHHYLLT